MSVAENLARIRLELPAHVRILAVTKGQPAAAVEQAIAAGIADAGENYVQEARAKFAAVPQPFTKHFIGHVQTNKAKAIAEIFDVVQSVDRLEAGAALAKAANEFGKILRVLIQLNISSGDRFGVPPEDAPALADDLRKFGSLRVDGIMAIGPLDAPRSEIARAFEVAASVREMIGGSTLSLGMSGDWREAVRAGSTMIRLGTALFGSRPAARV